MQSYDNKPLRNIAFLVCSSAIGLHFISYSYLGSFGSYSLLDFLTLPVVLSVLATYLLLAFWTLKRQKLALTLHLLVICLLSALLLYGLFKRFPLLQDNIFQVIFLLPLSITLVGLGGACHLWLAEWKRCTLEIRIHVKRPKASSSGFRPFSLFKHKLVVVEFSVEAVEFKELAVVALLDDFSVFEDDDFIRKSGSISLV